MANVKEKNTNRKTRGDSARRLGLVAPSGTETGSLPPDQLKILQIMLNSLESVAMLLRKDSREIVACNAAAREQGVTLGKTCYQSWANLEAPCPWCRAPETWKTGKTIRCQVEGDGRIRDAHWAPVSDDLYLHYARDITEEKQNQKALEEIKERYQSVVEGTRDLVTIVDDAGRLTYINHSAKDFFGIEAEACIGKLAFDFVHPDDRERTTKAFEGWLRDKPKWFTIENRQVSVDGEIRHVIWTCNPSYDSEGAVVSISAIARDITKRKRAEEELKVHAHDLGKRAKELRGLYGLSQLTMNADLRYEHVFEQAVELLPPAWQYPEVTCGRIVVNQKEYTTDNYVDTVWKQSAEILVSGVSVGIIEVAYLDEKPELFEGPFMREERDLIDGLAQILGQYIERVQNESRLRESNTRLIEGQLALEAKNTALNEVIEHVDREKKDTGFQIQSNINRLVLPMIAKLEAQASEAQQPFLSILKTTLDEITSPFVTRLEKDSASLSPREVEICNLIKSGLSSKDIALVLHTSEATVRTQRKTIRKKLGLSNSNTNLTNYLQQI